MKWANANPSDGVYSFKNLIDGANAAHKAGKKYGVSIQSLGTPPKFVLDAGGKLYTYKNPKGETLSIVLPFDPVVKAKLVAWITALCAQLDGVVDYIQVGEFGQKTESYMPLPSDINYPATPSEFIALYVGSSNTFLDLYGTLLKKTPFILAAGNAFKDPGSQAAVEAILDHGLGYPLFGIGQWGGNANSNADKPDSFFVFRKIKANPNHPNLIQLTGDRHHTTGGVLCGVPAAAGCDETNNVEKTLAAIQSFMPKGIIEVYSQDGEDPVSVPILTTVDKSLK